MLFQGNFRGSLDLILLARDGIKELTCCSALKSGAEGWNFHYAELLSSKGDGEGIAVLHLLVQDEQVVGDVVDDRRVAVVGTPALEVDDDRRQVGGMLAVADHRAVAECRSRGCDPQLPAIQSVRERRCVEVAWRMSPPDVDVPGVDRHRDASTGVETEEIVVVNDRREGVVRADRGRALEERRQVVRGLYQQ